MDDNIVDANELLKELKEYQSIKIHQLRTLECFNYGNEKLLREIDVIDEKLKTLNQLIFKIEQLAKKNPDTKFKRPSFLSEESSKALK